MDLLGDVGHVESHFGLFGDRVSSVQDRCSVHTKCSRGSEIVLDTPDGTLGDEAQGASFGSFGDSDNLDAR
jgi:hypothetical protein